MEIESEKYRKPEWTALREGVPWVIAHRGHAERFPENTLVAFRAALDAGADMVELDYRTTADGVLVCAHDDTTERRVDLDRSPGARGRTISGTAARDVTGWHAGRTPKRTFDDAVIPSLEDAIRLILGGDAVPVLERKTGTAEQTIDLLRRLDCLERVCVQSFDWEFLAAVHRAEPAVPLAALGKGAFPSRLLPEFKAAGVSIINWEYYGLSRTDVARLHQLGFPVWTWTVNRELEFHDAVSMEVDGVTTDAPDRLREFLCNG